MTYTHLEILIIYENVCSKYFKYIERETKSSCINYVFNL